MFAQLVLWYLWEGTVSFVVVNIQEGLTVPPDEGTLAEEFISCENYTDSWAEPRNITGASAQTHGDIVWGMLDRDDTPASSALPLQVPSAALLTASFCANVDHKPIENHYMGKPASFNRFRMQLKLPSHLFSVCQLNFCGTRIVPQNCLI